MVSQATLCVQLEYDADTGLFRWREHFGNRQRGWFAGAAITNGYLTIRLGGKTHYAHRLAWLYVYGKEPEQLDHINRVKKDNRIVNLRIASKGENVINSRTRADNKSGCPGVSKFRNKWQVKIKKGPIKFSRICATKDEAIELYMSKRAELYGKFEPTA